MKFFQVCAFLLVIIASTIANEDGNVIFDKFVDQLTTALADEGLDPADLPGKTISFKKKVKFINVKCSAKLYEGKLAGIKSMRRDGKASVRFTQGDEKMVLKSDVAFDDLNAFYRAKLSCMGVGPRFKANLTMKGVRVRMEVHQETGEAPELISFQMINTGKLHLERFRGLGPFNQHVKKFAGKMMGFVKGTLVHLFKGPVKRTVAAQLETMELETERR